ncbi:MAG: hypothetical protein Q4G33_04635 [bacterium]|nr:hypothetical protein [bacterium]
MPSKLNPRYALSFYLVDSNVVLNCEIDTMQLTLSETKNEIAQRVNIAMANTTVDGHLLSECIHPRDRVVVSADDGERDEVVFRGYVWSITYTNSRMKILQITAYDCLIYLMQTEDSRYYRSGLRSDQIILDICAAWGITGEYIYAAIAHRNLPMSGKVADMIVSVLDKVKARTKQKYIIRSVNEDMNIWRAGTNGEVFDLVRGYNVISTSSNVDMSKVVTSVAITSKADDNGYSAIERTVDGDTGKWGTLRRIVSGSAYQNDGTRSADRDRIYNSVDDEAYAILDEYGEPVHTFSCKAVDIPWVRKGDAVNVIAGDLSAKYLVTSIKHDAAAKTMELDLETLK